MTADITNLCDKLQLDAETVESDARQLASACLYYIKQQEAELNTAIELLKDCVNWYGTTRAGIAGARGDKVRAFLREREKELEE